MMQDFLKIIQNKPPQVWDFEAVKACVLLAHQGGDVPIHTIPETLKAKAIEALIAEGKLPKTVGE